MENYLMWGVKIRNRHTVTGTVERVGLEPTTEEQKGYLTDGLWRPLREVPPRRADFSHCLYSQLDYLPRIPIDFFTGYRGLFSDRASIFIWGGVAPFSSVTHLGTLSVEARSPHMVGQQSVTALTTRWWYNSDTYERHQTFKSYMYKFTTDTHTETLTQN